MALPTSYSETTLAAYMVQTLGPLADTLGLTTASMDEAVNDVALACGAAIADITDIAKVRALAKVGALRVAETAAAAWYDFSADGGSYQRSQIKAQVSAALNAALASAMPYDGVYAVGLGVLKFANDPYAWPVDGDAEGVG